MNGKPQKIISGGQEGADWAGLMAAIALGIPTGGTAPKGWRICKRDGTDGSNPSLADFGLVEHESREYPPRTIQNVLDSDGTVWFGFSGSPGGKLTINTTRRHRKPVIENPTPEQLREWVVTHKVCVLNVAGNRTSDFNPNIFEQTYSTIVQAFSWRHEKNPPTKTLGVFLCL